MISPATPIIGTGGTLAEAIARGGHANAEYFAEAYRICTGSRRIRFDVVVAQWDLETDTGRSPRWTVNRNAAGLGIESDSDHDPAKLTLKEAAGLHLAALHHAITGGDGLFPLVPQSAWPFLRHWTEKYRDPNCPRVVTVADLQRRYVDATGEPQATWAWDENYAVKLAERANAIFKESPMPDTLTFGNVPHPPCLDRPITKAEGKGQNDLGQRTVKGVTYHRMLGTLYGTDGYFRRADVNALTDYGVGVAAQDGPEHAGEIIKWNDPLGRQSGWASGVYSSYAYGDGAAFVAKYGVNAINRDRASIEISGFETTPLDDKSRQAIAALTAYWADQAEIPWDVFPIVPEDGFSFVCWHEEMGPEFGQKKCPFEVVKAETAALIERARQIMRQYQTHADTTPKPPTYAAPQLPEWFARSLEQSRPSDAKEGDVLWRVVRRNVEALKRTQRYSEPSTKAKKSGPPVEVRQRVTVERVGNVDGRDWFITDDGHFVVSSSFTPRVVIHAR